MIDRQRDMEGEPLGILHNDLFTCAVPSNQGLLRRLRTPDAVLWVDENICTPSACVALAALGPAGFRLLRCEA